MDKTDIDCWRPPLASPGDNPAHPKTSGGRAAQGQAISISRATQCQPEGGGRGSSGARRTIRRQRGQTPAPAAPASSRKIRCERQHASSGEPPADRRRQTSTQAADCPPSSITSAPTSSYLLAVSAFTFPISRPRCNAITQTNTLIRFVPSQAT